ncbi:hypothetical protein [Vibrio nigripulchritudo]|uniref:hypothetical protein n=1 Tax=Vibrio nigripulchritudo TaxID=28173 RepID=UPI0003FB220C|nr:hypothetical protein [Vibrio nigripulchritudo]
MGIAFFSLTVSEMAFAFVFAISEMNIELPLVAISFATCLIGVASRVVCLKQIPSSWQLGIRQSLNKVEII